MMTVAMMTTETMTVETMTTEKKKPHLFDDRRAGAIYRTAARMIYEKGFDATSMNEIAEAVELTKPGLYYYVKGKKELLFSIMSFAMDRLDEEVVGPAREIAEPEERLRIIIRQHARLLTREAGVLGILMDEVAGLTPEQKAKVNTRKRAYFNLLRSTLDELAAQGRLQAVDTTVAAFSILGMVMWLARWYDSEGRLSSDVVVRDLTEIAVAGMLRQGTEEPVAVTTR
jgi:AcrR family transcriptional regulator